MNWESIASWWNQYGIYGIFAISVVYCLLLWIGLLIMRITSNEPDDGNSPRRSVKPVAVMGILFLIFAPPAIFGTMMPWVSFEFQITAMVISALIFLVLIYYVALS